MKTGALDTRGFTLIETVMVIVLVGVIGTVVSSLLYQGSKSIEAGDVRKELSSQGRLAVERASREMRLMRCTTAGNSCKPQAADITAWTATDIRFVTTNYERIGLRFDAGQLKLSYGTGPAPDVEYALANNLSAASFEYLKSDGTPAAAVNEIWTIRLDMTLASGAETVPFRASVHPRSFR
ncbi:MAG: type II secretion system protein [Deltaproteobacteria bacterium]|nr:type II secretion system protein [Deltaproteobacteria bacterium]